MIKKKLVFDTGLTGHHSEYIGHLIDFLSKKEPSETEYIFVVHPNFSETFPTIYEKTLKTNHIHWQPIRKGELKKIQNAQKFWSSLVDFQVMNKYAKSFKVNHVYALDFHTIKYSLLFYRPSYTISSILFLQFHRMKRDTRKQNFEFKKRYYLTKWCSANRQLKRIFILNDEQTASYLNSEFKTDIFKMLPDPIPELEPLKNFDIRDNYGIETDRKIFLHIGALGYRKGTFEVIGAAEHIPRAHQKQIALLLVGNAGNTDDEQVFMKKIKTVKEKTKVQIIWDNQFVPVNMMKSLFDQCDTVLLPYKNAEFSSGILGHAAAAQKLVIATGAGLIKELVLEHGLGILLNRPTALNLAEKITEVVKQKPILNGQSDFVERHKPKVFAELVLKG